MQIAEEIALPCQPRVYALLMRELITEAPNLRRLNQLFGADPVMAAWLLECANHPAQQMGGAIRGISQAVTLLGVRHLRQVLKKAQAGLALRVPLDVGQWAQVSVASAKLARNLAGMLCLDTNVAYTAGLLHGLGYLLPASVGVNTLWADDAALSAMGMWDPRRARLERKCWGESADQRSAALLRQWHLPQEVVAAVQGMEYPLEMPRFDPMAGVVHLAVWCQRAKASGWNERQIVDAFPVDVALTLGVDVDVVLQQEAVDWSKSLY